MPFSSTASCSGEHWTWIFENLFKPAVEEGNLDLECRRSAPTRGSLISGIVNDLRTAHVVIADLTDRNANVFYEMGVRHSLSNRSIMVAQRSGDIPSDLRGYAYHIYDWRNEERLSEFKAKMQNLLVEVDGLDFGWEGGTGVRGSLNRQPLDRTDGAGL